MSSGILLHIYYDDFFIEADLSNFNKKYVNLGNNDSNDLIISSSLIENKHLVFESEHSNWIVRNVGKKGLSYSGKQVDRKNLLPGDIFTISSALSGTGSMVAIVVKSKSQYDHVLKKFETKGLSIIRIGKSSTNDIIYSDPLVSSDHAKIYRADDGQFYIADLKSTNGIYLNGRRIYENVLKPGDVIHICGYKLIYDQDCISIGNIGSVQVREMRLLEDSSTRKKAAYPYFQSSPRLIPEMPKGEVDIPNPPSAPSNPNISWVSILLPPGIMTVITIATAVVSKTASYAMMSLLMTAGTILTSVYNYMSQNNKYIKDERNRKEKYLQLIHNQRKELEYAREQQRNATYYVHPDIRECISRAESLDRKLWERTIQYPDFLLLRLGIGNIPFRIKVKAQRQEIAIEQDPLKEEPQKLADEFCMLQDIPVAIPLYDYGTAGLIGTRNEIIQSARALLLQIAVHHSYDDVKIVAIYPGDETNEWEWMRWLPHVWDESRQQRFLASDKDAAHELFSPLYDLIKERELRSNKSEVYANSAQLPHFVFLITDMRLLENEAIMTYLAHSNKNLGISSIFMTDRIEFLPKDCRTIIDLTSKAAQFIERNAETTATQFTPDKLPLKDAEYFARKLAPVRLKQMVSAGNLPKMVTMLDLFDVKKTEELLVMKRWESNEPYRSLATPLGIRQGGEKLLMDLHERGYGPHGLVAGTTGSGKSELLQSFIISLAINYHPHEVSFVLIDYKGGGMANAFVDLPHLVGTITNLGGNQTARALVSIKSELKRRQAIFGEFNVNHIDNYQKLYRKKQATEPLPHLIIIADEFAELKKEQPEFMQELVSAARVGRSLGVHLILATQKPSGVVDDQIWSNSRFKLCLKVQDTNDSQEVIKRPDAANIKFPGRAYLQVGNNEIFELFQSAWSRADYDPEANATVRNVAEISEVNLDGSRNQLYTTTQAKKSKSEFSQLQVLVKHLDEVAQNEGIRRLNGPWLPPLPENLTLNSILSGNSTGFDGEKWLANHMWMCPSVGLVDNPAEQLQYPLTVDFGKEGHLLVYGSPGYGKTTFLQTLITSLAISYSPSDVNIYIMDFGGRTLNIFNDLPHCGGVIMMDESEKLKKFIQFILRELDTRKKLFASRGVSSLPAYRISAAEALPAILIALDNYSAMAELYPDIEELFVQITREGGNLGIHVVFTAGSASSIRYKTSANFKLAVTLQLADKSDYSSIVGRTNGLEPSPVNGRGLVKGNPPLEFQTALAVDGDNEIERTDALRKLISKMSESWTGPKAKPVPIMPEVVHLRELLVRTDVKRTLASKALAVPIGLNEAELEPVYFDLSETPHFLVSGNVQSGKTNFLRALIITMAMRYSPEKLGLYIVDSNAYGLYPFSQLPHVKAYINSSEQLPDVVEGIKVILDERKNELNEARKASGGILSEKDFLSSKQMHLIVIDDFNDFMQIADLDVKDLFERILKRDRSLGVNLLVASMSSDIGSSWDAFAKALKELQTGLLLASASDQQVFSIKLPYGEAERALKPGDGYYVTRGRYIGLKTALMENQILKAWVDQVIQKYSE